MPKFNHLDIPHQWQQYWSRYPNGYSILEALINWVGQTNDMVDVVNDWQDYLDDFVETFDEQLQPHVESFLEDMETDGRLADIINQQIFDDLNNDISNIEVDVNDLTETVGQKLPITSTPTIYLAENGFIDDFDGTDGTDHTTIIQDLVDNVDSGTTIEFPNATLVIDGKITVPSGKGISLKGNQTKVVKTSTTDIDNMFEFSDSEYINVEGFQFDQNLRGRSVLALNNCEKYTVKQNDFTGYSDNYGHSNTDSAIRLTSCRYGVITGNRIIDWADQVSQFVRVITLQQSAENGQCQFNVIANNVIDNVYQAIVTQGGEGNVITGNTLKRVADNGIYVLPDTTGLTITGNHFSYANEAVVVAGENITVSGNVFRTSQNKFIAITKGGVDSLNITGNTFFTHPTSDYSGGVLSKRDTVEASDNIRNVSFSNNTIKGRYGNGFVRLSECQNTVITDNIFDISFNSEHDFYHCIRIQGTTSGTIVKNNLFKLMQGASATRVYAITIQDTPYLSYIENNIMDSEYQINISSDRVNLINQRHMGDSHQMKSIENSILFSDSPITSGTFKVGDFVFNTSNDNFLGWKRITSGDTHVIGTDWIEV